MDAYPSIGGTLGGGGPMGRPRMNLKMHLHLNSKLASNEFFTEFAFKIREIPSRFALVRQSREQATVSRKHSSMSVGGHALPPHPLILKWLHPAPPPQHTHTTTTTSPHPLILKWLHPAPPLPPTHTRHYHHHNHHYPSLPK